MIERLEYSRGVPSRFASGARRGLISAAAFALQPVWLNEVEDEADQTSTGTAALVGGGVGLVLGSALGALYPNERWKHVRLENHSSAR
jgi:hypothetical protein